MNSTQVILWSGSSIKSLANLTPDHPLLAQSRFFIPTNVVMGRFGIVAMLIADNRPEPRHVSYSDSEWTGVKLGEGSMDYEYGNDPVRRAHFENTEDGFSIIRAIVLPPPISAIFDGDAFLGEPMLQKCAREKVFDPEINFDEEIAGIGHNPAALVAPLMKYIALDSWEAAGIEESLPKELRHFRAWVSFHGWFAYQQAISQAEESLKRALANFDTFISKFATDLSPHEKRIESI